MNHSQTESLFLCVNESTSHMGSPSHESSFVQQKVLTLCKSASTMPNWHANCVPYYCRELYTLLLFVCGCRFLFSALLFTVASLSLRTKLLLLNISVSPCLHCLSRIDCLATCDMSLVFLCLMQLTLKTMIFNLSFVLSRWKFLLGVSVEVALHKLIKMTLDWFDVFVSTSVCFLVCLPVCIVFVYSSVCMSLSVSVLLFCHMSVCLCKVYVCVCVPETTHAVISECNEGLCSQWSARLEAATQISVSA